MPDANMDTTLNALFAAGFGAAGQRCMAINTVLFVGGSNSWYSAPTPSTHTYSFHDGFSAILPLNR